VTERFARSTGFYEGAGCQSSQQKKDWDAVEAIAEGALRGFWWACRRFTLPLGESSLGEERANRDCDLISDGRED